MRPTKTRVLYIFAFGTAILLPQVANAQDYFNAPTNLSADTLWTNYIQMADLDSDGDLDVIAANCSGFFSTPGAQAFQVFTNAGNGTLTNGTATVLGAAFSKAVRQFAVGDVDGDGKVDLYVPDAGGNPDRLFISKPSGPLVDEASTRLPSGLASTAGATRFGDFDSDGDLDILVLNGYAMSAPDGGKVYLNDGTGTFAELPNAVPAIAGGQDPDDVDLGDFDRDYDLDVLVNVHEGKSAVWLNDGTGKFTDAAALPNFTSNFHYGPATCDVDGDTDLDLWIDNVGGSFHEMLLINGGSASFTNGTSQVTNNPGADDNGVVCVDIDNDGDLDAAIPSLSDEERVLRNDGSGNFTNVDGFPSVGDPTLWLDFGDLNGDGRLDAVTGQGECGGNPSGCIDKVYIGSSTAPVDTQAPNIIVTETPAANANTAVRFAVSDSVVSDTGPRLKRAFLKLTAPSASEIDARFMGGDLFRAEITNQAQGATVTFTACAIDREDNEGCGQPVSYTVSGTGTGGAGGSAGAASGGSAGSGNASGSAGTSSGGTGTGGTGTGGAGGNGFTPSSDDGGCGCRITSDDASTRGLSLIGILLGLWLVRRAKKS